MPTLYPSLCKRTASIEVTSDLPTPPLPLTIPTTCLISLKAFAGTSRLCGFSREEQLLEQVEQSCVHSDIFYILLSVFEFLLNRYYTPFFQKGKTF
jgi:hypothetical protein